MLSQQKIYKNSHNVEQSKYQKKYRFTHESKSLLIHEKKRYEVIKHYSNGQFNCNCCGESIYQFLTVDHINNDGAEHRRKIGYNLCHWLVKNDYPKGFKILCMNCNWGKRVTGTCPHKA